MNIANQLSNQQLMDIAPSIFAAKPWERMSENYKFIPTITVVNAMRDNNFLPVKVAQSRCRIEGKEDYTKHMIRFRHTDYMQANVGDELPEIVLVNSHDGTSAYNLMAGIFRLVCSNGMVINSADMGSINVRHSGKKDLVSEVIEGSYEIISEAPKNLARIASFKEIELSRDKQEAFAAAALELKGEKAVEVYSPDKLLESRRFADYAGNTGNRDLWRTMNVVQENLIRGGARAFNPSTRRRVSMRPIKSVSEDIRVNKALWMLTEKMATLAA